MILLFDRRSLIFSPKKTKQPHDKLRLLYIRCSTTDNKCVSLLKNDLEMTILFY